MSSPRHRGQARAGAGQGKEKEGRQEGGDMEKMRQEKEK